VLCCRYMVVLIPIMLPTASETLQQLCLGHPQYSPDLAPSDFCQYGPLRDVCIALCLAVDHELKVVMHIWLATQSKRFYCNAINLCGALPSVLNAQELC
jgi:hypothetical protein